MCYKSYNIFRSLVVHFWKSFSQKGRLGFAKCTKALPMQWTYRFKVGLRYKNFNCWTRELKIFNPRIYFEKNAVCFLKLGPIFVESYVSEPKSNPKKNFDSILFLIKNVLAVHHCAFIARWCPKPLMRKVRTSPSFGWKRSIHGRDSRWMSYETAAILNQNLPYIPHIIG